MVDSVVLPLLDPTSSEVPTVLAVVLDSGICHAAVVLDAVVPSLLAPTSSDVPMLLVVVVDSADASRPSPESSVCSVHAVLVTVVDSGACPNGSLGINDVIVISPPDTNSSGVLTALLVVVD